MKFDLLGLGMLSVLHYATDLIAEHHGVEVDLATLPQESCVYDMLQKADSIGVSRSSPEPRWPPFPGSNPARSTTSSSRWP